MKKKTKEFLKNYMDNLPEEILDSVGWTIIDNIGDKDIENFKKNTVAILQVYRHMKYKDENIKLSFERLCHIVENELLEHDVELKDSDYMLIQKLVTTTITDLIMTDTEVMEDVECCKFIVILHQYVEELKRIPKYGESYYNVIAESYINNTLNLNSEELINKVCMSRTNFYRVRKQAINELTKLIWM